MRFSRPYEVWAVDTGNKIPGHRAYKITYSNIGRREACYAETESGARETVEWLRFQGAERIRVYKPR